jgi:hypothetical protein
MLVIPCGWGCFLGGIRGWERRVPGSKELFGAVNMMVLLCFTGWSKNLLVFFKKQLAPLGGYP